jgi:uncharacterized protein (TIGR02145 family)
MLTTPRYCWYSNDSIAYANPFGALYNWYAINTSKLCPTGWHVPTIVEWETLKSYLGGTNIAGGKLKEAGTTHWANPNTGATNETGFTALPGGIRQIDCKFDSFVNYGYWWSATENLPLNAWYELMGYSYSNLLIGFSPKNCGFSVRCVKD